MLHRTAVQKLSERLKENAHVAVLLVLFRKHYHVTILKWDFTADIIAEMPQLFFSQDVSQNTFEQLILPRSLFI